MISDELLQQIRENAAILDRTGKFGFEEFDALAQAGYLRAHVPTEFGGGGLSLTELTHQQALLASASPGVALAVNMHHVWVAVARQMYERGDESLIWLLQDAAAGEIFAFGISEPGNDLVLFGSDTTATAQSDGSYAFSGVKIFTSLSPVWTQLGTFGVDSGDPHQPQNVYAFIPRGADGITIKDDWDAVGMRASGSCTTILKNALAPADRVVRKLPPGPSADPLLFGIFSSFEVLLASVYTGIAERALAVAVEVVTTRTSKKNAGAPYSDDPDIRWRIARAGIALEALWPQIERLIDDLEARIDHGPRWFAKLSSLKVRATETARLVVDEAIRSSGGRSYFNSHELSRLHRDVLAGIFHPSDDESAHNTMATALLGSPNPR